MDVFFYEAFAEEEQALRRFLPPTLRAGFSADTVQEQGSRVPPASLLSVRTQSVFPIEWAPTLSGILTRSTGYDHLVTYRRDTGTCLPCGYLPLYCNRAVAEQAMLLWLALLRRLPRQLAQFRSFARDGLTGRECGDRALAVFGVGNVGHEVVRLGKGIGMRVLGVDIERKWGDVVYVDRDQALAQADVVVCAMNLTPDNRHYFDRATLSRAKPGLVFVNVARGELMDTPGVLDLVDSGQLAGVGLDVYEDEPGLAVSLRTDCPPGSVAAAALLELSRRPQVMCTPHNAFNTAEAVERKAEQSIHQIRRHLGTGEFAWSVPVL